MTIEFFHCEQGSEEWHRCRLGIPTASNFAAVMAKGEGKTRRTYMMKLLGERFCGEPAENFTNGHMDRGKQMEDEARRLFAFMNDDIELSSVGFIRNGNKGCSPDNVIGDNGLLEIKTRLPHLQLEAIFAGKLPPEHQAQLQGGLWVSEREFNHFVSYWPKLPLFTIRVARDEKYIANLDSEVSRFNEELDSLTHMMMRSGATVSELFTRLTPDPLRVA